MHLLLLNPFYCDRIHRVSAAFESTFRTAFKMCGNTGIQQQNFSFVGALDMGQNFV